MKKLLFTLMTGVFLLTGSLIVAQDSDPHACCIDVGGVTDCNRFNNKAECTKYCPTICVHVAKDDPVDTSGGIQEKMTPGEKAYWLKKLAKRARKHERLLKTDK
jgi:hypothetical protein